MSVIKRLPAPAYSQFIINTTCRFKTNHQTILQRHHLSSSSPRPPPLSFPQQHHRRSSSLQTTATQHPTSDSSNNFNQKATVNITILVQDHCSIQLQATLAQSYAKDAIRLVQLYHFYNMRCKYLDQAVLLALEKHPTTINLSPETLRAMEDRRNHPPSNSNNNNNNNNNKIKYNDAAMRYLGFDDLFTICQVIDPDLTNSIVHEMKNNSDVEDWVSRSEWEMWKRSMRDTIIAWYCQYYNSSSSDNDSDAVCRMRLNTTTPEGYSVVQSMEVKWEDEEEEEEDDSGSNVNDQSSSMRKKQLFDNMKASKFKSAIMGFWAQVDSNLATDDETTALKGLIDASWGVVNVQGAPHLTWSVTLFSTDDDKDNFIFRGSNAQELKILGTCLYEMVSGEITGKVRLLNNRHTSGGGKGWWWWWPFGSGRKELSQWIPKDWNGFSFQAIEGSKEKSGGGGNGVMYVVKKKEGDAYTERVMARREMWALIDGMDALLRSHPSLGKKMYMGSMHEWLQLEMMVGEGGSGVGGWGSSGEG